MTAGLILDVVLERTDALNGFAQAFGPKRGNDGQRPDIVPELLTRGGVFWDWLFKARRDSNGERRVQLFYHSGSVPDMSLPHLSPDPLVDETAAWWLAQCAESLDDGDYHTLDIGGHILEGRFVEQLHAWLLTLVNKD